MYKLVIRQRATNDTQDAYQWYEEQKIGLGDLFIQEIRDSYAKLETHPVAYHKVEYEFRQFNMKKFPYVIVYDIDDTNKLVIVYTIFHNKRNPKSKFKL